MHSYLLISKDPGKTKREIEKILENNNLQRFEHTVEGIADIRELESFTKLSREGPIGVVIKNFNKATPEASNAFLKNLEEPTGNIHYILTAPSIYNILPTITSRCQIIKLTSEDDFQKEIKILKSFLKKTTSGRLEKISNVRKRDEAIDFMEVLIKGAHSALYRESTDLKKASEFIINANYTLNNLNANGNVALQLTNFVVSIA